MRILDCTLRDGGYYNNWSFEEDVVQSYLSAMAGSRIDFVELGLRNFPQEEYLGPYAYTTEQFINSLDLPIGPTYGVMVDAKTILSHADGISEAINKLFVASEDSKIKLVRIAAHFKEVDQCGELVKLLKAKGYIIGFNLMQAAGKESGLIAEKVKIIAKWEAVDVLYFADSLGNMNAEEVCRIIKALRSNWQGELGIHTHNNMARALENTITAYENGVDWLDVTVTGMGRGAGNAQTENLLATLSIEDDRYNPKPVYSLVIRYFSEMQKKYGWGSSLLYFIGAQHEVHPTYIQNLLVNSNYGAEELVGAIDFLCKTSSASYDGKILEQALKITNHMQPVSGNAGLSNAFENREVLILGGGASVGIHIKAIRSYIKDRRPVVLAVNINKEIEQEYIDYYVISHNAKYLSQHENYVQVEKPLILPKHRFAENEIELIEKSNIIHDYGIAVQNNVFEVKQSFCILPYELTIGYALAVSINGGASKITLVGCDGYDSNDLRQQEMIELFFRLSKNYAQKIIALTPTTYPIAKGSIYAPNI